MSDGPQYHRISGRVDGNRIESRVLEEKIQAAVENGFRCIEVEAYGHHGIGGRLWKAGAEPVHIRVTGHPGQRLGAMGSANTRIEAMGPASDDVGWLNAGAEIVVHGNAGNGAANAMAQGRVYVAGSIGARGMTMTKHNPRFSPPELWVLGSAGDYFGEFMAGGVAVVCGIDAQTPRNILGYRPLVGMVSGKVFFRGPHGGYSKTDARLTPIGDADWEWLEENLRRFLTALDRMDLYPELGERDRWQLIAARTPGDKVVRQIRSMQEFHQAVWNRELGEGGMLGDLAGTEMSPLPVITSGGYRRYVPVWANRVYKAPCEAACPTGIPVHDRWRLIRDGRADEAVDMALAYTPFPAAVCGYLCPNLCMQACTRQSAGLPAVDTTRLGKASIAAGVPELPEIKGGRVAVVGGGPAGISVAWQLRRRGHEAVVYDRSPVLGGKISTLIPQSRIPADVVEAELSRVREVIPHVNLQQELTRDDIEQLKADADYVVIATGAQRPKILPVPGKEHLVPAGDFLRQAKEGGMNPGAKVVVIGAGNVGCDVAVEARRLGAEEVRLIDVQEPASFGKERADAEQAGAEFRWPCFTKEITGEGVLLDTGELLPADTVVVAVGDVPDTQFLPESVRIRNGHVAVNEYYQTTDPRIFAIGDAVGPGLLTDAIGAGRTAAAVIADIMEGRRPGPEPAEAYPDQRTSEFDSIHRTSWDSRAVIDKVRVKLEYFDPRITGYRDVDACGAECASCGACRDCGICEALCPQAAISRVEKKEGGYEYVVDPERCIGCGFCAGACPCGVWELVENEPL
jgi:NADPH-dependent glutamate synthase beta subunit-like oxidoreductase/glutamate synthase domain-containing protein 3/NAD-dependent dihydropyrimidine dehydrogenase PreA subunit